MIEKSLHNRYLGEGPRKKSIIWGVISILITFFIWYLVTELGIVKPLYLPSPSRVLTAYHDIEPNIGIHTLYTLSIIILGYFIGLIFGFLIGFLMRHSFIIKSIFTPIIESWRPTPLVGLIPFFILWFGFSYFGKIVVVSLGTFLIIVVGVLDSIDALNPIYLRIVFSFGGNNLSFLRYAALKGILPNMLSPMRIALASAVTLSVVSEFMGATMGLGYLINISLNSFSTHTILLCVILLGIIGGSLDLVIRNIHSKMTRWAKEAKEAITEA